MGAGGQPLELNLNWNQLLCARFPPNRAVGSFFVQRKIYGSNFYNLHLSFNIPAFFPQGSQHCSCQKGLLISQTLFALLVSFIIFMFSIGPTYIPFLWDPRSNWQQAVWEPSSLSKGNEDDVMGSPGKMSLAYTFQISPVNPSSASPKCPCGCQTFFSPFLSIPDSGGFGGQNVMF